MRMCCLDFRWFLRVLVFLFIIKDILCVRIFMFWRVCLGRKGRCCSLVCVSFGLVFFYGIIIVIVGVLSSILVFRVYKR